MVFWKKEWHKDWLNWMFILGVLFMAVIKIGILGFLFGMIWIVGKICRAMIKIKNKEGARKNFFIIIGVICAGIILMYLLDLLL